MTDLLSVTEIKKSVAVKVMCLFSTSFSNKVKTLYYIDEQIIANNELFYIDLLHFATISDENSFLKRKKLNLKKIICAEVASYCKNPNAWKSRAYGSYEKPFKREVLNGKKQKAKEKCKKVGS